MRGINPVFLTGEDREALEQERAAGSKEEKSEESESAGGDQAEEASTQAGAQDSDEDITGLQKKLIASDKDRTRQSQESAALRKQLQELDPLIRLGALVKGNPQISAVVAKMLSGQELTAGEEQTANKALGKAADAGVKAGLNWEQFLDRVGRVVSDTVETKLQAHLGGQRAFQKLDTRAKKELPHYEALTEHPGFIGMIDAMHVAIENGTLPVPDGEDKHFHAVKVAHDAMLASNPEYVKAVKKLGIEEGKRSTAKKLAAAGPGDGASRGNAQVDESKISQADKDRLGMIRAWVRGGGKRLPSAR